LHTALTAYRQDLAQILHTDQAQTQFMRYGARVWRLQQALINGLLKQFLHNRRAFAASTETMQNYLNLFTLWHNMRVYQRSKRQGSSPYQITGIHTASDDWLELLGYPAV
jgi:hypothetical protein